MTDSTESVTIEAVVLRYEMEKEAAESKRVHLGIGNDSDLSDIVPEMGVNQSILPERITDVCKRLQEGHLSPSLSSLKVCW